MDPISATRVLRREGRPVAARTQVFRLRVRSTPGSESHLTWRKPVLRAGTHPGNDLVLQDDAVSRIHFEITTDEHGFRLRDLGSTNGTFVDGRRANDVYLASGARLRAGSTTVEFEPEAEEAEIELSPSDTFDGLVGTSASMRSLFAVLEQVAKTDYTVLIEGETGAGKELVAESIHRQGLRAGGPFVVFDCAAVAPTLLESTLFGHERGAFTGALAQHVGCLEEANGGTLFLDELGELPIELQGKLLRALERRELRRLGGTRMIRSDARIVAATNRDLSREVNLGSFRADLYYRIAVVRVRVPPLRERPEDIPALVERFVAEALPDDPARTAAVVATLTEESWERLLAHPWPGNVRELRNVVHRTLALGAPAAPDAGPSTSASSEEPRGSIAYPRLDLDRPFLPHREDVLASFERAYLTGQLERHGGVVAHAARAAQIDRVYFRRLLQKRSG